MSRWLLAALAALCLLFSATARADVQRFAVVIGNNAGEAGDTPLRFAEADATRVYEVLRDLGGFSPVNMVLLKGENAGVIEETLIAVNDRVRTALAQPGSQVLLFVYYSGHADGDALHAGRSRLGTRLLSQLLRGSAATFRLLVLDACRSGEVTRAKGGHIVPAATLSLDEGLPENGLAFLTASAAHEDAQESDAIGGSFFTHAFVSGLMGAADQDGDGAVSLNEAYEYAYGATIRATSRTLFGTQHPAFRFDLAGQGALALTRPAHFAASRAVLEFPPNIGFLVLRDGDGGAVVGEVGPSDKRRSLSVKPGRYFVRGRGSDVLYEGMVDARASASTLVLTANLTRIDYARLVRKGGTNERIVHGPEIGARLRSALSNTDTPCMGGFVGYSVELPHFGVRGRLAACTSRLENDRVEARTNEYDLELRIARTWDVQWLSLALGLGGGAALFTQRYETAGNAPPRDSFSPYVMIEGGAAAAMGKGFSVGLDVAGETHFVRIEQRDGSHGTAEFALRLSAFARKAF